MLNAQNRGGDMPLHDTAEYRRLEDNKGEPPKWWRWGPYVSERAWGTVREDYSAVGVAWCFLLFVLACCLVFRWGVVRSLSSISVRTRAVERPRSDTERTRLRPHAVGRQPRRGREGILFL